MLWHPLFAFTSPAGVAPPPVFAALPTVQGAGAPRRFVVPPEMAKAAQRLAGDNGVVEAFIAMLTVGIFNDHG